MKALAPFQKLMVDLSDRGDAEGAILEGYGVEALPTMIFFDGAGRESSRMVGSRRAPEIVAAANDAATP